MLEDLTPPVKLSPCRVREVMETLEPKDQEILKKALENPAWGTKTLSNALRERGLMISDTPITKHRAGRCSCAR
jgi:hypothetical protein